MDSTEDALDNMGKYHIEIEKKANLLIFDEDINKKIILNGKII